jgi:hypothetical protein
MNRTAGDALNSPMARYMMEAFRKHCREHEGWEPIARLLHGPALDIAKRRHLTIPLRLPPPAHKLKRTG